MKKSASIYILFFCFAIFVYPNVVSNRAHQVGGGEYTVRGVEQLQQFINEFEKEYRSIGRTTPRQPLVHFYSDIRIGINSITGNGITGGDAPPISGWQVNLHLHVPGGAPPGGFKEVAIGATIPGLFSILRSDRPTTDSQGVSVWTKRTYKTTPTWIDGTGRVVSPSGDYFTGWDIVVPLFVVLNPGERLKIISLQESGCTIEIFQTFAIGPSPWHGEDTPTVMYTGPSEALTIMYHLDGYLQIKKNGVIIEKIGKVKGTYSSD